MLKLNKQDNGKALHIQLAAYFRERILDGRLQAGTRLPTELELASEHHISRDTVRRALTQLVEEGLLERVQGRGTFVRQAQTRQVAESAPAYIASAEKRIGVVLTRPAASELNMEILIGVEQSAKSHGYHVSFSYTDEDQEQETRNIARLKADRVQGFIIFPVSNSTYDPSIWQLQADKIPFILLDRTFPGLEADYVGSDNFGGGFRATEHLLILGHTRIGFVNSHIETRSTTSVYERWNGYKTALEKYSIPYEEALAIPNVIMSKSEALQAYRNFILQPNAPTAIFAVNDLVAMDIIQVARKQGIRVPEDLAIVGYDDLSLAAHVTPALTTIKNPLFDFGLWAGNLLISRIEGQQTGPARRIELPTSLIIRESCGASLHIKRSLSAS
ncbi:GntR family transcriptional regulator [Tengunoibacter tsumagoiensis]|uniref:LacI family transcriptional regulator n=1 Tax=Tengunoibacter tsumagoiensis TaxID=2014871 RepID=A0A402A4P0_9CHLR|nr:GntR family transcriptional regulator [Tengunoibacter tsumagoiensis]GCE14026.1 LacI family transcriptional regulator [Tengunoibacter tsumagoiensis]